MLRKVVSGLFCAVVVLASQAGAFAQTTQVYNVIIDPQLSITPLAPAVSINHDQTDGNQVFPVQDWNAKSNNAIGATVAFSASRFQATVGSTTYTRNAKMDLALGAVDSGAGWAVTTPSATTAGAAAVSVDASSTAPGDATLNLTMTFVDSDFSALPAATFSTTVTATITAN